MKKKTKQNGKEWTSGIGHKSNMSYEKYIKAGLDILSPNLSVRLYKLAPKDEYPMFERGRDTRVAFFWKDKPAIDTMGRKYEFVVESTFWFTLNTNKEDREWMRQHANHHLECFYDAIQRGKSKIKNKPTDKKISKKRVEKKTQVGSTQKIFEEMKKSK
jgi:hypothetical protein